MSGQPSSSPATAAGRRNSIRLAALREIARSLSTAWDLDTTLDLIARKTTEVMDVDSCTIYLLDPDGQTLRLRATTGLAQRALGRATLQVGEGMTGYAVQRNEPVYASDAQHDPHFKWVDEAEETAFRSLLAVPLALESRPIGALNVQTRQAHRYSQEEIAMLSLIAELAAGALAKAQLYDNQRRQIEELRALAEVSEVVTSPQYLDDMLDVVTDMAATLMDAAVCSLFLLDDSGQQLMLQSAKRTTTPYRHRPPLALGQGVIGRVALTGQPLYVADVRRDRRYLGRDLARKEGLVSLLAVPLSVRDRVIGVLNCYTAQEHAFSEEQRALFLTLANQTALAIENARLVTNAAIVREMHHRIKNNLQTVAMLMRLQLGGATAETRRHLQASIHRVHSIAAVHEILSERGFHLVNLAEVLERLAQETSQTVSGPERTISIRIEGEALSLPSRAATNVALVVNELIQNAVDHAFAGRDQGQVRVSLGSAPDQFIILVSDNGSGLPADLQPGLGLEIVETLVRDELRGRLKFNPGPDGRGTEVSIRLPRSLEQPNR
ncbi:MAG: GAF domain-containing protein [Candidatus Promineifilaceae bacterium]|nr:GAF domain-containing protein [Candidatus Promineifilaceae bacterium]